MSFLILERVDEGLNYLLESFNMILHTFLVKLLRMEGEDQMRNGGTSIHLASISYYFVQRISPLFSTYISH
jgi:hypothetical protein